MYIVAMRSISEKKLAKLGGKMPFSSITSEPKPLPRSAPKQTARKPVRKVNVKRRASEFARCYHSRERVRFVKAMPCAASGFNGPIENAHVIDDATKGAGRKSGYRCIAPLLGALHRMLHRTPEKFRALYPTFDAERAAAATEAAWLASQGHVASFLDPEQCTGMSA